MAPSSSSSPTPIEALYQSCPHPTSSSDMDLTELTDQIFEFSQKLWILHVQLLVLLLMFIFLSLQCIVPKARIIV